MRIACFTILILFYQPAFSQPANQKKILVKTIDSILQSQVSYLRAIELSRQTGSRLSEMRVAASLRELPAHEKK